MLFISNELDLEFNSKLSFLYFYSDGLLFHKKIIILFDKIESTFKYIKCYAVDIDHFENLSKIRFKITSIPTILIMKSGGKEIKRIKNIDSTSNFLKMINDIYVAYGEKNDKKVKS